MIIMIVACIYGGYTILFPSSRYSEKTSPLLLKKDIEALNKFAVEMAKKIKNGDRSKASYILNKATVLWEKDFFAGADLLDKLEDKNLAKGLSSKTGLSYSGYIMLGNKMLSIINGMEYEVGDNIDKSEYSVLGISPVMVVLGTEKGHKVILPLEEKNQGGL